MISKAEQQVIIKMQDATELAAIFKSDVFGHTKLTSGERPFNAPYPNDPLDQRNAASIIGYLNLQTKLAFEDGVWAIDVGGQATKKKVNLNVNNLSMGLAKALIIYVRKYF